MATTYAAPTRRFCHDVRVRVIDQHLVHLMFLDSSLGRLLPQRSVLLWRAAWSLRAEHLRRTNVLNPFPPKRGPDASVASWKPYETVPVSLSLVHGRGLRAGFHDSTHQMQW